MIAGYSGTPLAKKLGLKDGFRICNINPPDNYLRLLAPVPDIELCDLSASGLDIIHIFTNSRDELCSELAKSVRTIKQNGSIWVSWYKKASKRPTEITEDVVRATAFPLGLVDVKVCAVDENWSGLKLVIRRENRV